MKNIGMRPAECLTGLELEDGWYVDEIDKRPATATGGKFSVGYIVTNRDGKKAFLKAIDFSVAAESPDLMRELQAMTTAFNFERDLLIQCKDRKLRRIVRAFSFGVAKATQDFGPILTRVPYIIFEKADGDIRGKVYAWNEFDLAWVLRSMHQSAVGVSQLHSIHVAHQDLKPSNVLIFPDEGLKISDLGRASHMDKPSENDKRIVAGDLGYAAPDQWYSTSPPTDFTARYVADIYHLGSLIFFYFLNCSATQIMALKLSEKHQRNFTSTTFVQDLPYLQYAFGEAIVMLRDAVQKEAGDLTDEIIMIAQQLCNPDPIKRGDPGVLAAKHIPQYDLQPYISRFDRLARKAERKIE